MRTCIIILIIALALTLILSFFLCLKAIRAASEAEPEKDHLSGMAASVLEGTAPYL